MKFLTGKLTDDQIRKQLSEIASKSWQGRWIASIYSANAERFDSIIKEWDCDISGRFTAAKYILAYYTDELSRCEVCGKGIIKPKIVCSNPSCQGKSETVKHNREQSNLEKYGVKNVFQLDSIKEKSKNSCRERYGVDWYAQTQEHQDVLRKSITEDSRQRAKQTMQMRFGVFHNAQEHLINYQDYSPEFIFESFRTEKNEWDLIKFIEHFGFKTRRGAVHKLRSVDPTVDFPHYHKMQHDFFKSINAKNKLENDRSLISPLELDIVIPDIKLAIEFDGAYWHSEKFHDRSYHLKKTEECEKIGYTLFHIFETDNMDIWKSMIDNKLGLSTKVYARECEVHEISAIDAYNFLSDNHLQGGIFAKKNYGLFYKGELLEVITFSRPRYNPKYDWELIRLCTKRGFCIVGGASRLFHLFIKENSPKSIISYANRRFSQGNVYERLGFNFMRNTAPNYFWVRGTEIKSRVQCQRHKLGNYPKEMTEANIMHSYGYWKLYDCGNMVFNWTAE